VRGYAYQSLGVKDGAATVGGRYLAVFSVEATHWISPAWGVAAFIDAGDAADRSGDLDPAIGLGFGARWKSPAGPIGIDLARGQRNGKLHLHFALAIPF
jgi:translocation and assembly module TamA